MVKEVITEDAGEFRAALPDGGVLLGLDLGTQTIGTAFCDAGWSFASAGKTLPRGKFARDKTALEALVAERRVQGFVIGLPLNMDGSSGPSAQAARAFARNLLGQRDVPLLLWDERLSSAAVNRALIDADTTRARRAAIVDKLAASYVLQGVLDRLRSERPTSP